MYIGGEGIKEKMLADKRFKQESRRLPTYTSSEGDGYCLVMVQQGWDGVGLGRIIGHFKWNVIVFMSAIVERRY